MMIGEYKAQEVRCPYCSHTFMTMNSDSCKNKYLSDAQTRFGWSEICPNCSKWLIVLENESEGKREADCLHIGDIHIY